MEDLREDKKDKISIIRESTEIRALIEIIYIFSSIDKFTSSLFSDVKESSFFVRLTFFNFLSNCAFWDMIGGVGMELGSSWLLYLKKGGMKQEI